MINPVFVQYPEEAKLLGEIVLGYGELDISFAMNCGAATRNKYALLHAVNQVRSETGRLDIANALAAEAFQKLGVSDDYIYVINGMRFCLKIRNQWAHCQWGDLYPHGLAFTKTDGNVFAPPVKPIEWKSITLDLLKEQEAYFEHIRMCLIVLESNLTPLLVGKPRVLPMPKGIPQPSMHNHWSKSALSHVKKQPPLPH